MAYDAGRVGGTATVCLNASNEEAVFAFLKGQIKLFDIIDTSRNGYDILQSCNNEIHYINTSCGIFPFFICSWNWIGVSNIPGDNA